ncbi:hypothetical protein N7499_008939 [Penicillium canescens]|nr:hypothetical protein N7499_008939 [Penicillium canescens]KAJ6159269.1 hypothetical protein N7485_012095 [Penicillium canescens]
MQSYIQPSHPGRLRVLKGDQPFQSSAQSLIALPAGALFAKITTAIPVGDQRTYTSVATGRNSQIELNSDLVFCNHSCKPSLVFDMKRFEVRVVDDRPLEVGDDLTFFYPSSEWEMVQPFQCQCNAGASHCLGLISGASQIEPSVLHRYWLNDHIRQLVAEEREQVMESSAPSAQLLVDDSVVGVA